MFHPHLHHHQPATKAQTTKSTIPSFLAKSNNPFPNVSVEKAQSPVIPEPSKEDSSDDEDDEEQERLFRERIEKAKLEELQKSKVQSQEREATHNTVQGSLGAMQGSGSPVTKSTVPSFLSKSNNQFPSSTVGKIQSPVIPEPSKEDSSDDEDDEEQERLFRERIEKAKLEEQEKSKQQLHQQEVTPPISRGMTPDTKSKIPSFLNRSNNVFTASSFNAQPTGPVQSLSESSHSPKDDEWDVVEKEPTSPTTFDFNPTPGHAQHLTSSFFSSTSQSPSNVSASSTSKFDEAFGGSLFPSESNNSFSPTAFDDAFDIPSKPYTNPQESNDQPQQHTDSANDEVLFRVRALYDYKTAGADDLGFLENDYIQVSQTNDDGDWWYGKLESNGSKGWFPKSYVEQDVGTAELPDFNAPAKPFVARVLYDYQAQQSDELSVKADAQIDILEKIDENWWRAQVEGHIGLVPSTYCEELIQ
ncbi:hypothetical protein K7432_009284 [Basidiobolus ranarum]|uniref:SH3 domain-containing protein n=1 Tax=Basidiobolus ranarum TaxID=34480 RepID=A0ABR2VY61_9FUNG